MSTMTMTGFGLRHLPTRPVREAARTAVDPYADIVSTGRVGAWDLFSLRGSSIPGASEWADRTLDTIVAAAVNRYQGALDCPDCEDIGFYGLVDREDPDILTSLLRRVDDKGYEVLTASAGWKTYEITADQHLEILTRDLAGDLAEAVTSGASGLVRRYFMPAAFLPPDTIIAAGPAPELADDGTQQDADTQGWREYAVVDDLDPGAVIDVIRLRRGPAGPELAAYRSGAWAEAPDLLSQLQGVQPPPLVELSPGQMANVLQQIDAGDAADQGGATSDDQAGAQAVAASLGLTADSTSLPEGGYPITDTESLKKAVRAFGRSKNPTAAKRHIIKRARALDAVGMLPESWGITAAFVPNRVPSGSPGGGQFAPEDASTKAANEKKAKKDQQDAEKEAERQAKLKQQADDHAAKLKQQADDRARKQSEHEQDRTQHQTEHEQDRARRQAEHAADRAQRAAEHQADLAAKAAKKKATAAAKTSSSKKKSTAAKKADYGNGGVLRYDTASGTIFYKDGSSYNGKVWKTASGARITASGGLLALVADAPLTVSPDPRAEKLRRYWAEGKGALKIRWGTPGDWKRCYRQLTKYMGLRAKGYCQNLHKRATGIWTGSRLNPGGHRGRGRAAALAASGTSGALSMEAVLVAAMSTGRWFGPEGGSTMVLKDGIYVEGNSDTALLRTLTAGGGFPVAPPDEWFDNPQLDEPTPLTVDDSGRVHGHLATFDRAHIGLPGKVHAPKSRSNYAYFKTGQLVTASGKKVNVGQLTLAGGHAPLNADASAAVAHYDNTASAVADLNVGEDRWGIWAAGAVRPEVTPSQLRALRASAPSGDWRPINGHLELVACCQVNVPGFPIVRARVASGAITSLVAAGSGPLYARRLALMADASVAERVQALESVVFAQLTDGLEDSSEVITADGDPEAAEEGLVDQQPVTDAMKRAREAVAARRAAQVPAADQQGQGQEPEAAAEEDPVAARLAELRERVHGTREPVAAGAGSGNS
jgi:hypothetical protein